MFYYKYKIGVERIKNIANKKNIILSVSAVISGVINGFIGTGGGIILYFALKFQQFQQKNKKNSENNDNINNEDSSMKDILATTVSAVIPMSVISSAVYMLKGRIIYKELLTYLPAALIGGIIGALLLDKLKFKIVKKIFAAMLIYAGIRMIFN